VGPCRAALYRQVGASGTGHEIHRPPPPHQQSNPIRSKSSAAAAGSTTAGYRLRHRLDPEPVDATWTSATASTNAFASTTTSSCATSPWRARRPQPRRKGTKVYPVPLPCLSLSLLNGLIKNYMSFSQSNRCGSRSNVLTMVSDA
jgi:hypothetical protein